MISLEDPQAEGVYGRVIDNKDLLRYESTAISNRHAVAHAFKAYDQAEHSLNAIFHADLMFWLTSHYVSPTKQEDA